MACEHTQAEGLWQFDSEEPVADDGGRQATDLFTFAYHGDTVTLRLLTLHPGQWRTGDDFYRLAARWEGDMLSYRPPFGPWAELAAFDGERFVNVGSGRKRIFRRIAPDEVVAFNRDILTPGREAHDYRIRPDGSLSADV
jgi:hypothetical protein